MSWDYGRYLELCSVLTSRSDEPNYEEIVEELMGMLEIKAIISTDKLLHEEGIDEEQHHEIMVNIEQIFANKLSGQNYIGFINIILLQCVIAFTKRFMKRPDYEMDSFLAIHWTNTEALTEFIKTEADENTLVYLQYKGKDYTLENIKDPSVIIFLVRWNDKFSSDEIIRGYFLNIQYGEVVTSKRWADNENMTPYYFLAHDITHLLSSRCYTERGYNLARMNHFFDFYKYCSTLNVEQFRKIRVYVFLQIHEGGCYLDPNEMTKKGITIFEHFKETINDFRFSNNSGWDAQRLTKKNDLMGMVPKSIVKMKPMETTSDRNDRIKDYLFECIRFYKEQYNHWNAIEATMEAAMKAGFSKKRRPRSKKFRGKTRKGKRHLGKV